MTGRGWRAEETAIEKLKAVTPAQIQEVASRYLKNISFTVLGDKSQVDDELFTSR